MYKKRACLRVLPLASSFLYDLHIEQRIKDF